MNISKAKKRWGLLLLLLGVIVLLALYPLPSQVPIRYYDRQSGLLKTEKVAGEKWLVWLYHNPVGEATLWALAKRKVVSSVYGNSMDRPSSAKKIHPFVEEFDIDMRNAQKQEFHSFNDFFTRKLKNNARLAQNYLDGTLVIIRLAPFDYHRFHFPMSGRVSPITRIDGDYYSVNPLALRKMAEIFCLNKREFTILSNPLFGDVVMTEVGATNM